MYKRQGQGGLNTGAYGFSSMAAAIMGLWYGILSFTEDDCNYILARIGMALEDVYKRQGFSCPNVKEGGIAFGQDPKAVEAITKAVKAHA